MARKVLKRITAHKVPKTLEEAYAVMRKRVEYLAREHSSHYPIIEADLVQAGKIAVQEALDRYSPTRGASFRTFCDKVVRHAIIDELKMEMKRCLTAEEMKDMGDRLYQRFEEDRETQRKMRDVKEASKSLTPRQRQVIEATITGDLTDEIAQDLGLSVRQTTRIRHAAIEELQGHLIPPSVLARMKR